MVYSSQNSAFRRDKHHFFSQISTYNNLDAQFDVVENRLQSIDYSFLLKNQSALEIEFTEMFALLQKQDIQNKKVFWLYCYYCASLLEAFYRAYAQEEKQFQFKNIKQQIKNRLMTETKPVVSEECFIQSLKESFITGFRTVTKAPFHLSQIRDYVAYANLCRIYWVFCRITLVQSLTIAKDLKFIEKLDAILGTHIDVDKIIAVMQAPVGVINYLSVGFFLIRFMIDGGLLLKHTFFPSELEKGEENGCDINKMTSLSSRVPLDAYRKSYIFVQEDESDDIELYYISKSGVAQRLKIKNKDTFLDYLAKKMKGESSVRLTAQEVKTLITNQTDHVPEPVTPYDRFKHELYKRHCNFANDIVWATINFLTNFNHITKIPTPVTGYITSVFLVFDISMAFYKCYLAKQEYLIKKGQYTEEIAAYNNPDRFKKMSAAQKMMHIDMLNRQLAELEINWQTKEATFYFIAAAAALLMAGFTASLLVSTPLLMVGAYLVCTIAVALYLSVGAYSQYKEKNLYLEQAQLTGLNLPVALKEYEIARNDFIFTLIKNTVMPLILITTFAICWPAAVVLTAMYAGFELFHAYNQHVDNKAAKQLALTSVEDEQNNGYLLPSPH